MELKTSNHGSYPRMGEKDEHHLLRKSLHLFDRKKITLDELNDAFKKTISTIIQEQNDNGLDVVTDGMVRWNDPVSHFMRHVEGVSINGLLRFFDTNFYFRQPVIEGKMKRRSSALKDELTFLKSKDKGLKKAVLLGPYTTALLSKLNTDAYASTKEVAETLADLLAEEVQDIASLVDILQVEEPMLVNQSPDWEWARGLIKKLADKKGNAKLGLVTYFGDAAPHYEELQKFPVDFLGLDFTYSPTLTGLIQKKGSDKDLSLGLLDGRNTKLEDPNEVVSVLKRLKTALGDHTCYLTTSCGLEYLPRDRAFHKLQLLKTIKKTYQATKDN